MLSTYPKINLCNGDLMKSKKIVVLLSGGLDSSTLAYYVAKKTKARIYALTIDYGQRHDIELLSAAKIAKEVSCQEHKIIKFDLTSWGGSALTDRHKHIPKNRDIVLKKKQTNSDIPITYVPARNTIFLSLALSYAEAIGASEIYIGVNAVDYSGYVDCRPKFINEFQKLANVATVAGIKNKIITIKAPLLKMSKSDIVKLGKKLGVNWSSTWSCYQGKKVACGECDSCLLRLNGFAEAGITDPIRYKKTNQQFSCRYCKRKL